MSIFDRFFVKSSSRKTTPVRKRQLRLETLESRELLSVSTAEFAAIRSQNAGLNLSANMSDYNVIEITANELSDTKLRAAIVSAGMTSANDLIVLRTTATQNSIELSGSELFININASQRGSITIVGFGAKPLEINAKQESRIFEIYSLSTEIGLAGLTITNGNTNNGKLHDIKYQYGSGINNGGKLTITNCTISNNTVTGWTDYNTTQFSAYGGGIYNTGTLTITSSTISGNRAYGWSTMNNNKSVYSYGGGIWNIGRLTITDCIISDNVADTMITTDIHYHGYGGGIYNDNELSVIHCIIFGNTAMYGGGILNDDDTSTITMITRSTLSNNSATEYGGGIYNFGALSITASIVSNNAGAGCGGGIYNNLNSELFVTNCIVVSNTSSWGGGIYNCSEIAVTNCTITENYNTSPYNDYSFFNDEGTISLYNTIVTDKINDSKNLVVQGFNNLTLFNGWSGSSGSNFVYDLTKPLFVDAANGNYRLAANSQAINKGDNSDISGFTTDLAGNARIQGGIVDIGAYEYQQSTTLGVPQVNISQSNGNVTLNWSVITDADRYSVYRLVNGKWTSLGYVTVTTFTDSAAPEGLQTYAVRAFKGTAMSDYQPGVTINVVPAGLGIPQVNISQSNGNVTLTWTAIPTATHYGVYRMVNGKWTVVNANVTATTFTENNVPEGLQTYAVRAFKGTVMSDYQRDVTITILGIPQVTPMQSNGKVTLNWAAIANVDRYCVYRLVNGKWTSLGYVTATTFTESTALTGLQTYAVRAFKGTAMSDYQRDVTITILGIPQVTPTKSNSNVTLTWSAITGADRYCVYRLVNGKWTSLGYVTATTFTESTALTGLQTYAVRAFKGTAMSDYQQGVTIIL